eukprot:TRINITY_DN4381_c0_g1_i10.p2 TRINITY_DN4381_c0_g1~~TRINITY_DN4381_c0_g1_i10.p2  ORF type:complete len:147 (+),score=8.83 TRINITY_DN4381_c0_g1_i10:27-443(+)
MLSTTKVLTTYQQQVIISLFFWAVCFLITLLILKLSFFLFCIQDITTVFQSEKFLVVALLLLLNKNEVSSFIDDYFRNFEREACYRDNSKVEDNSWIAVKTKMGEVNTTCISMRQSHILEISFIFRVFFYFVDREIFC